MLEYIKNPETWLTLIAVIISIIALWQTHQQIKLSNKQQLFDRKLSRYLEFNIIYHLYEANKIFLKDDGKFYHTNDLSFVFDKLLRIRRNDACCIKSLTRERTENLTYKTRTFKEFSN